MRDDIYKDGIHTQFSSKNQPDPEKKRVPHYKTKLKKHFIEKGIDKLIEIASDDLTDPRRVNAALRALEDIKEWVYGKEANIIQGNLTITDNLKKLTREEIEAELKKINGE